MKRTLSLSELETAHDAIMASFYRISRELDYVRGEMRVFDTIDHSAKIKSTVESLRSVLFSIEDVIEVEKRNANKTAMANKG